jgi:radical SAM protein with 4Fe4S-binding SPASM domain
MLTPLPKFLQIEPVGQCNLRCQMCPIQFRKDGPPYGPPAFMPIEVFKRILHQMPDVDHLHLQGLGEPLMHPRIFDMIEHAVERGIEVSTNTNLTLLTKSRAERCVGSGLAQIHVSIDGATPETYNHIRVRSNLDRVLQHLEWLNAARAQTCAGLPSVRIVTVVMRQNLHELAPLVRLAHEYGVSNVHVQHLCHDFGESSLPSHYRAMRDFINEQTLLHEESGRIEAAFDDARQTARQLGVELRLPRTRPRQYPPETDGRSRCDWPWTGAYISYDGQAMPCCMVSTPDRASFGNVLEDGVLPVWNGTQAEQFRAQLDSPDPPEICKACSVYQGVF